MIEVLIDDGVSFASLDGWCLQDGLLWLAFGIAILLWSGHLHSFPNGPFCHLLRRVVSFSFAINYWPSVLLCSREKINIFGVEALAAAGEKSFFFFAIVEPLNTVLTFFHEQTQCQGLDGLVVVWDVVASCL